MADAPQHVLGMRDFFQKMMTEIAKADKPLKDDTDVTWEGTQLKLPAEPERMTYERGIEVLVARKAASDQKYTLFERIPGMPFDAAAAFVQVLKQRYGWVHAQTKQTWFGEQPPRMQVVKTGHKPEDYIEVPVGEFKLDDISVAIETGFAPPGPDAKSQFMDFYIRGEVSYADRAVIMDIISATRKRMAEQSIYRGKPLRLRVDSDGNLAALIQPEFIDLDNVDVRGLILKDDIQRLLDMTLNTPIERTAACRKHKIPLKRGILLHGPYGTGKSLTGSVTARRAINSGWTFVMVDDAEALSQTLEFARQFQPCVVFAEDIDRAVTVERDDDTNDIVNTIDSVLNKSDEIIVVLTTNHIDKLPPVILRPGRLDALIPIDLPDATAAIKLVGLYAGQLLQGNEPLTAVGDALAGFMPSTIREVVERAKLAMLMHDRSHITASDIVTAATGIRAHADLLKDKEPQYSAEHQLGAALKKVLLSKANGVGVMDEIDNRTAEIKEMVKYIHANT